MGIHEKRNVTMPPAEKKRKKKQLPAIVQKLLSRVTGIVEGIDFHFTNANSLVRVKEVIDKHYSHINRNPKELYGDFNGYIPIISAVVSFTNEEIVKVACDIPKASVHYKHSDKISNIFKASLLIEVEERVELSIDVKGADLNMYSKELHKLIYILIDYNNCDNIYHSFKKYSNLAKFKAAGLRVIRKVVSSLQKLCVNIGPLQLSLYGSTSMRKKDLQKEFKFPESDFKLILPSYFLLFECSTKNVRELINSRA